MSPVGHHSGMVPDLGRCGSGDHAPLSHRKVTTGPGQRYEIGSEEARPTYPNARTRSSHLATVHGDTGHLPAGTAGSVLPGEPGSGADLPLATL